MTLATRDSLLSLGQKISPLPRAAMRARRGIEPDHHSPVCTAVGEVAAAVAGAAPGVDGVDAVLGVQLLVQPAGEVGGGAVPAAAAVVAVPPRLAETAPVVLLPPGNVLDCSTLITAP